MMNQRNLYDIYVSKGDFKLSVLFKELESRLGEQYNRLFERKKLKKGTVLLKQGEVADTFFFLERDGIARVFIEQDDVDLTTGFIFPFEFGGCFMSSKQNKESYYSIQLLSDSYVRVFLWSEFEKIKSTIPVAGQIEKIILESTIHRLFDKTNELRYLTATERYSWIMTTQPQLVSYIPSVYLAQYLGISPECLSRIRSSVRNMNTSCAGSTSELVLSKKMLKKKVKS